MSAKPVKRSRQHQRRDNAPRHHWWGSAPFTLLSDELRESIAYKSLRPVARLVLLDMIGFAYKVSDGSKDTLAEGFKYTFAVCRERCSENAFDEARKAFVERGFFECPLQLQPLSVARPAVYVPSTKWREWRDPVAEKAIARREAAKREGIKRDQQRRTAYLTKPRQTRPQKQNAAPKFGGIATPKD